MPESAKSRKNWIITFFVVSVIVIVIPGILWLVWKYAPAAKKYPQEYLIVWQVLTVIGIFLLGLAVGYTVAFRLEKILPERH